MTQAPSQEEVQQQAGKVLGQLAGYVGARTIEIGLAHGLFEELAKHSGGLTPEALAQAKAIDPFYANVWCRSAYASEVLDLTGDGRFTLAPHMDKLLLDEDFPGFIGAMPGVLLSKEVFDSFSKNLAGGQRTWWDQCSPAFIQAVSGTGRAFYNRLIPAGLARVPGLEARLGEPARVLDLACGAGVGLTKLAAAYPSTALTGLDGDAYSLGLVEKRLREAGLGDRVSFVQSTLEEFAAEGEYDVIIINISMHECRDIERVAQNVHRALAPGGYFVISDMPFPETTEACRTVPARIMSGIQFFEAQIDDQLLPTQAFADLLTRNGFSEVAAFDMTPVHAVTHGRK